jgi:hypothetical protein
VKIDVRLQGGKVVSESPQQTPGESAAVLSGSSTSLVLTPGGRWENRSRRQHRIQLLMLRSAGSCCSNTDAMEVTEDVQMAYLSVGDEEARHLMRGLTE